MSFYFKRLTYKVSMSLFLIFFTLKFSKAQINIVPNYSFEQYITCPSANTSIDYRNSKPNIWYKPDSRQAGYLNACAGDSAPLGVPYHPTSIGYDYQYARTGVAYIGMFYMNGFGTDARNYFQIKLSDSLFAGKCYYAECFVNRVGTDKKPCNNQSILFTDTAVYANISHPPKEIILANPQVNNFNNGLINDTLNWIKVSGIFRALGGEQYLTLGNFQDDNNTNYAQVQITGYDGAAYYVDDVSHYALDSFPLKADAGSDTTIALGDSVFIGSLTNGIPNITWYDTGGNVIDTGRPGFYVKPITTTTYIIEQTVCGYYSRDTVTVTVNLLPLHWLNFNLTPGPSPTGLERGDVLLRWQTANEQNVSHYNIQRSFRGTNEFENVGRVSANNTPYNEYSFVDDLTRNPASGGTGQKQETALYRIQSIDKDGMRSYSEIRRVVLTTDKSPLTIYPNPAKDYFIVESKHCNSISVINCVGQSVVQLDHVSNRQFVSTKNFPKGLYNVQCINNNGEVVTARVVVE